MSFINLMGLLKFWNCKKVYRICFEICIEKCQKLCSKNLYTVLVFEKIVSEPWQELNMVFLKKEWIIEMLT